MEEQVAVQIVICRTDDGREWYRIDAQAPFDRQLEEANAYGDFASTLIQACEKHIPSLTEGRSEETIRAQDTV